MKTYLFCIAALLFLLIAPAQMHAQSAPNCEPCNIANSTASDMFSTLTEGLSMGLINYSTYVVDVAAIATGNYQIALPEVSYIAQVEIFVADLESGVYECYYYGTCGDL